MYNGNTCLELEQVGPDVGPFLLNFISFPVYDHETAAHEYGSVHDHETDPNIFLL
jgi:hypothetical protein